MGINMGSMEVRAAGSVRLRALRHAAETSGWWDLFETWTPEVAASRVLARWIYECSNASNRCERKHEKAIGRIGAQ